MDDRRGVKFMGRSYCFAKTLRFCKAAKISNANKKVRNGFLEGRREMDDRWGVIFIEHSYCFAQTLPFGASQRKSIFRFSLGSGFRRNPQSILN